ncbi:MAG: YkgJ family cysteine cluster protein [Desulfosarcina sp.]|nr:YkgJ family cysteine cluster protein [Desulfosarcina sp.]MBC2743793.1 YkgJ family cysteine cluster protein [Desulfosarcina sp.]MBC2766702.1 YkgJ family cysteine cluster protein [Desulfosarcina sp.]
MQHPVSPLEKHETFCFTCSPQVACFNACCRDLNQVLTPYDVLCLKQFLKMSSTDFLNKYTEESTGPGTGLPVVSLRFSNADDLACPFVTGAGCRVYPARPASCRTYPLARGVSRNRETGNLTEHWALIREPHCLGFKNGQPQTVDEWVDDQQIATHNRMNDMMLELISLKNRFRSGPLMPSEKKRVFTALYDLDAFRDDLLEKGVTTVTAADIQALDRARTGDLDLLLVAMDWVRKNVFTISPKKA